MTITEWLRSSTDTLTKSDITSSRLDCLILLEDELGRDRSWLLAHDEIGLTAQQIDKLNKKIALRTAHTPLAYIRGHSQFYGRDFLINPQVLIPRPESESIIELLKNTSEHSLHAPTIIDLGTGSGALAITAKLELPMAQVYAVDIDPECLDVAARNATTLEATVEFYESDLLIPRDTRNLPTADILLANLPYVPNTFEINQAASHEPRLAIFGGDDGLDVFRSLFEQIDALPVKPSYIICEALPVTHMTLTELASFHQYRLQVTDGFAQRFALNKNTAA